MKTIPLTQNQFAIVDDEDYLLLNRHKWHYVTGKKKDTGYARTSILGSKVSMHNLIIAGVAGRVTDHINQNGLDNRKENLRKVNYGINSYNRRKKGGKYSKYGYVRRKTGRFSGKNWSAVMMRNGVTYRTKHYYSDIFAALAADELAKKVYGEYARLNFE